jgi:3-hydroxybutyryl-CoA dehydrogenase
VAWVDDQPGFISARVIVMIINEAFLALGEGVSSKNDINTAMKLGTNYPYGPFEWAEKIGIKNIITLLKKMSATNPAYTPARLLTEAV